MARCDVQTPLTCLLYIYHICPHNNMIPAGASSDWEIFIVTSSLSSNDYLSEPLGVVLLIKGCHSSIIIRNVPKFSSIPLVVNIAHCISKFTYMYLTPVPIHIQFHLEHWSPVGLRDSYNLVT